MVSFKWRHLQEARIQDNLQALGWCAKEGIEILRYQTGLLLEVKLRDHLHRRMYSIELEQKPQDVDAQGWSLTSQIIFKAWIKRCCSRSYFLETKASEVHSCWQEQYCLLQRAHRISNLMASKQKKNNLCAR